MKNISHGLIFILILQLFTSCDPPHNIRFINKTDSNLKIKINLKSDSENYHLKRISNGDSIIYILNQKDNAYQNFGIGTWSSNEIDSVVKSIKCIEIETNDKKIIYKSEKSLRNLLKSNVQGLWLKTTIEIDIE
jgi:hypothetical protein